MKGNVFTIHDPMLFKKFDMIHSEGLIDSVRGVKSNTVCTC
jgi:hypothetical protein